MRTLDLNFDRPTGVEGSTWQAIQATIERLRRAVDAADRSQAVGEAKNLVESVAKSVLAARGEVVGAKAKYTNVINEAHAALVRQPGLNLTQAEPLRSMAQSTKTIALQLGEIRNAYGNGHGRAEEPNVTDEVFELSVDAAVLWTRWALRRLDALAQGTPGPLIHDLLQGEIFTSGLLTERLMAADLPRQDEAMQRRVGIAVAQRAMRQTWVIRKDGIEDCALSDNPEIWPTAYRKGAFEGLFIDPFETLTLDSWSATWASRVIAPLPDPTEAINSLTEKVDGLPNPNLPADSQERRNLFDKLSSTKGYLPIHSQDAWNKLTTSLDPYPSF